MFSQDEEFDKNRVCDVTLTMGSESRKIATLTRLALNRTLETYAGVPGEYEFTQSMSMSDIVDQLERGTTVKTFTIMFLPGDTLAGVRARLEERGYSSKEITEAFEAKYDHPLLKSKPASPEILMEAYDMGIMRVGCKMDGTTRATIRLGHKLGMIVSLWPGNNKEDFFLGAALGCDAMCCDRFFEVAEWAEKNLPFVKIKGYEKPNK